MDINRFKESLQANVAPAQASIYLQALWFDAKGNWQQAHELIQDVPDEKAAIIHAYLHRKEGDVSNADWWYRKAGQPRPAVSLQQEWEALVAMFLG